MALKGEKERTVKNDGQFYGLDDCVGLGPVGKREDTK